MIIRYAEHRGGCSFRVLGSSEGKSRVTMWGRTLHYGILGPENSVDINQMITIFVEMMAMINVMKSHLCLLMPKAKKHSTIN